MDAHLDVKCIDGVMGWWFVNRSGGGGDSEALIQEKILDSEM